MAAAGLLGQGKAGRVVLCNCREMKITKEPLKLGQFTAKQVQVANSQTPQLYNSS